MTHPTPTDEIAALRRELEACRCGGIGLSNTITGSLEAPVRLVCDDCLPARNRLRELGEKV